MALFVTIAAFLATLFAALGVLVWLEARKESLPARFRKIAATAKETESGSLGNIRKRVEELKKRLLTRPPDTEELMELVMAKDLSGARLLLSQAGYRTTIAYQTYLWVRVGLPAVLSVLAIAYGLASGLANRHVLLLVVFGAVAGFFLPDFFLRLRISRRHEEITDSLPDAMDLMVVCVEAGMGLNAAFVKISDEFKLSAPVLSGEFDIVNREMVAGKPRQDALRALADRAGVEEVKSLVAMLIQTEKLGTSLSQSLRVHSDSLRTRRRQRAEEAAAKTTIKLVFPLVFLLFPALFVVILGPGVIQIIQTLLPVTQK